MALHLLKAEVFPLSSFGGSLSNLCDSFRCEEPGHIVAWVVLNAKLQSISDKSFETLATGGGGALGTV